MGKVPTSILVVAVCTFWTMNGTQGKRLSGDVDGNYRLKTALHMWMQG